MKKIILKEVDELKTPYKSPIKDMVGWVKATTVSVKGDYIVGGLLVNDSYFICTRGVNNPDVLVQFDNHSTAYACLVKEQEQVSFYKLDKPVENWVGLPNRTEQLQKDSFLFSFVQDKNRDRVIRFKIVLSEDSEIVNDENENVLLQPERKHTYPVVDMYGYLVGLNLGYSHGEVVAELLELKTAKL